MRKSGLADHGQDEETWFDEYNSMLRELFEHIVFPPFPPAGVEEPAILDCGFGTGVWIDDLLREHGPCDVSMSLSGLTLLCGSD